MNNNNNLFACVIITLIIFGAIIMSGCSAHAHRADWQPATAPMREGLSHGHFAPKTGGIVLRNEFRRGSYYEQQLHIAVAQLAELTGRDDLVVVCDDCFPYDYAIMFNDARRGCVVRGGNIVAGYFSQHDREIVICHPSLQARATIQHEILHALGFPHTSEEGCLMTYPHYKNARELCETELAILRKIYNPEVK